MSSSYFYLEATKDASNAKFIDDLQEYANRKQQLIYVLSRPLTDQKYVYSYDKGLIVLSPKFKISIVDFGNSQTAFDNYVEDIVEDIGSISDKYQYKETIGRPRVWRSTLIQPIRQLNSDDSADTFFHSTLLTDEAEKKKLDLLISLFIGSINDIDRVKSKVPETILDKVKQKIQLFDGDQTRFIYQTPHKKRIIIQGLSGTGKTELLLHKLKDLYVNNPLSKIYFTCHNKILADSLRKRIPRFFNFMKVEQQIEWENRLWCTNAWGSFADSHSGAYRYICSFYDIPFYKFSKRITFSSICKQAIEEIKNKYSEPERKPAFTYMFIDESQDFDENFFNLCELVTEKNVYVAGDIFQSIFAEAVSLSIDPDFLLGKCYRTDPKTLMFAHALGMGLFEENKLRWLEKKEWEDCGYTVQKTGNNIVLSREPLRRFEDLDDDFESIRILEIKRALTESITRLIADIKEENDTIKPEDIAIIFLDQADYIYEVADTIEYSLMSAFGWKVNKAYESKEEIPDAVFVTNRNNVKGLEFPFVICVTQQISAGPNYRNALYTMLTRSFIKSYLVIPSDPKSGLTENMKVKLAEIIKDKKMTIEEPSSAEKERIRMRFKSIIKRASHYDTMMTVFSKLKVDKKLHEKLFQATQQLDLMEADEETLADFVRTNLKYLVSK